MADGCFIALFPAETIPSLDDYLRKSISHPFGYCPLHVTIKYEFYGANELSESTLTALSEIARTTPRFEFKALPLSAFAGISVLYLTPAPIAPFEGLAHRIDHRFPEFDNGESHIPHLTVASGYRKQREDRVVSKFNRLFSDHLPLSLTADRFELIMPNGDGTNDVRSFRLGEGDE